MTFLRRRLRHFPLIVQAYGALRAILWPIAGFPTFLRQWMSFRQDSRRNPRFDVSWSQLYPCLSDATETTGFDRHYTFHTAWAARILAKTRPAVHHDFGSAVYFSTIVSAFVPVRFYDVRPARLTLSDLVSGQANLTQLPFESNSIGSLSCMHVMEHVGLGRYGDRLDPQGDLKAMEELKRVVQPGGDLLFVVPLGGKARIQFNAHRIYTPDLIESYFKNHFDLREWTLIPDDPADGDLVTNPPAALVERQRYGCGCFWFKKRAQAAL